MGELDGADDSSGSAGHILNGIGKRLYVFDVYIISFGQVGCMDWMGLVA